MTQPSVLLVDDEERFTANLSRLLRIRGYRVHTAASGPRALQLLREESMDVVVVDLKMPDMDGIETIRKMPKSGDRPRIIVLTGHGSIVTKLQAAKLDVSGYLSKPCRIQDLTSAIETALAGAGTA